MPQPDIKPEEEAGSERLRECGTPQTASSVGIKTRKVGSEDPRKVYYVARESRP